MDRQIIKELSLNVEQLHRLTEDLLQKTEDFPAIHRNAKRILASTELLRLNVEES